MPKERIYDSASKFDIEIGWTLDRDLQVGIVTHDGQTLEEFLLSQASPAIQPGFDSLWTTLDRRQVNRLIKMLRKARDDAYGRDE